jgi:hypothetical protein
LHCLPKEAQRTSTLGFMGKKCFYKLTPAMIIVSDPGDQAVGRDYSFQEEEQTMHTTGGQDCGRPSEEAGEENENNQFEEEDDLEEARVSPILENVFRHIVDPHFPGNQYTTITRL